MRCPLIRPRPARRQPSRTGKRKRTQGALYHLIPEKPVPTSTCRRVREVWTPTARPFCHARMYGGSSSPARYIRLPPRGLSPLPASLACVALFHRKLGNIRWIIGYPSGYMPEAVLFVYDDLHPIPSLNSHTACTYVGRCSFKYRDVPACLPISSCLFARPFRVCSLEEALSSSSNKDPSEGHTRAHITLVARLGTLVSAT